MEENLLNLYKQKKQKKEQFLVFSVTNSLFLNFYKDLKINLLRFDIEEFAFLNGFSSDKIVFPDEFLPILKNIKNKENLPMIAVDVPLSIISNENNILSFYKESNADVLVLNTDYDCMDLLKKLCRINIPFIIYSKNKFINTKNNEKTLQDLFQKFVELEHLGSIMFILDNFSTDFISHLKETVSIPVIINENKGISDGFYGRFSSIFGIGFDDKKKYLNINDLIIGGIKDCLADINIK